MSEPADLEASGKNIWTRQQQEELRLFQSFRNDYALPAGTIEHADKPDVLIHGDRTLGIELTTLYIVDGQDAASEQRQTKPREHVVARAQELHVEAGGRPIELAIGFDPRFPITDVEGLARSIAEVAAYVQRGEPGQVEEATYDQLCYLNFIYFSGEWANPRWFVQQSYSVPILQVNRVREVVADKIEKAKEYRPCDAYWLVITVDFWDPAQDQDIEWPTGQIVDCGPFERVFLHKPAYRRVIEIPST
ncbi:hypothetical protein [Paraburkholderia sediminicola]|uniref:hypothetical protein n=1 Tax=Paraburkholderia sediminicola TaxID=458836 RepID=UPI0038B86CBC